MRAAIRRSGIVAVALVGSIVLSIASSTSATASPPTAAVTVGSVTVLIMGGTGHPLSSTADTDSYVVDYLKDAVNNYVEHASTMGTGIPPGSYNAVAVVTPEEFAPDTGTLTFDQSVKEGVRSLDNCITGTSCDYNTDVGSVAPKAGDTFVVYGFSQSSTIATQEKRALAAEYADGKVPAVSFVFTANGNRPNGGFLARGPKGVTIPRPLTFGGSTFSGPTPTDTRQPSVDVASQYDGWSEFPENPLNLAADINALMGIDYLHLAGIYQDTSLTDAGVIDQGRHGDTHYYMISTAILPLLMPLEKIPVIGGAVADALDAPLRVLIESAYDRSTSPGVSTPWNVFYFEDPLKLGKDFLMAIPTGLDNGVQDLAGSRPLGSQRPGPYGVGGPGVTYTTDETKSASAPSAPVTHTSASR